MAQESTNTPMEQNRVRKQNDECKSKARYMTEVALQITSEYQLSIWGEKNKPSDLYFDTIHKNRFQVGRTGGSWLKHKL